MELVGRPTEALKAFDGSLLNVVALIADEVVGFGRVISDGVVYGLLVDVMVHPDFRRRGIGRELTDFVLRRCTERGLQILKLLASREGKPIYLQSGFTVCSEDSPGMIKFLNSATPPEPASE